MHHFDYDSAGRQTSVRISIAQIPHGQQYRTRLNDQIRKLGGSNLLGVIALLLAHCVDRFPTDFQNHYPSSFQVILLSALPVSPDQHHFLNQSAKILPLFYLPAHSSPSCAYLGEDMEGLH